MPPKSKVSLIPEVPRVIRAQHAAEILVEGFAENMGKAAKLADLKPSTFRHYLKGRALKEEVGPKLQKITVEEETAVVNRCEELGHWGFPPEVWNIHGIAETIAHERDSKIKLGNKWFELFKKRHPEVHTMYVD